MFASIFPFKQEDAPLRAVRGLGERLRSMPAIHALDDCYRILQDALAVTRDGARARDLLEDVEPVARALADSVETELDRSADNPVRRELLGKRLALLGDQLANSYYVEARREVAAILRGGGGRESLRHLAGKYWHWLGIAHTARARIDPQSACLPMDAIVGLFQSLHALAGRFTEPLQSSDDKLSSSLAYLLLVHDAFKVVSGEETGLAARCCTALAGEVRFSASFHRQAPLRLTAETGKSERQIGWEPRTGDALYYGLEHVVQAAQFAAHKCDKGRPPRWLEPDAARPVPDMALLQRLAKTWSDGAGRGRNPTVLRHPEETVAFDFLRIRGLVSQRAERFPANDPLIYSAVMHDADNGGFGILLPSSARPLAEEGLIAMHLKRTGWSLAAATLSHPDEDEQFFLAARWLGQDTDSIRLQSASLATPVLAIWLAADPTNQYQASVLLTEAAFPAGTSCKTEIRGKHLTLQLGELTQLSKALFQYKARVLE